MTTWLARLAAGDKETIKTELQLCRRDAWRFVMLHVLTEDTHALEQPFQPFPDLPHLFWLFKLLERESRLIVPKARQMSATWSILAFLLHKSLFYGSRLIGLTSKREEDAAALVERMKIMYLKLPKYFKTMTEIESENATKLIFSNRSKAVGFPSGPDQARGYTFSDLFVDEGVYQLELSAMLAAAMPAIGQSGSIILVSSMGPSTFSSLVQDI